MSGGRRLRLILLVLAATVLAGVSAQQTAEAGTPETLITINERNHVGPNDCATGGHCNIYDAFAYANTVARPHIVFNREAIGLNIFLDSQLPYLDVKPAGITIDGEAGIPGYSFPVFGNPGIQFGIVFISDGDLQNVTLKNIYLEQFGLDVVQFCPDYPATACAGKIHDVVFENVTLYNGGNSGLAILGPDIRRVRLTNVLAGDSDNNGIYIAPYPLSITGTIEDLTIESFRGAQNGNDDLSITSGTIDGLSIDGMLAYDAIDGVDILANTIKNVSITNVAGYRDVTGQIIRIHTTGPPGQSIENVTIADSNLEMENDDTTSGIEISSPSIDGVNIRNVVLLTPLVRALSVFGETISNVTVDNLSGTARGLAVAITPSTMGENIIIKNSEIRSESGTAINVGGVFNSPDLTNVQVLDNTMEDSQGTAILLIAQQLNGLVVQGNTIRDDGDALGAIYVSLNGVPSSDNAVRFNEITDTIGPAIHLLGNAGTVTVLGNRTSGNGGLGLDIDPAGVNANDAGDGDDGLNTLLNFPEFTSANEESVSGTTCANCLVDLFVADDDASDHGEGKQALIADQASAQGVFTLFLCSFDLAAGTELTATATDAAGNTSEFSLNFAIPVAIDCASTPEPSETPGPTIAPGDRIQGDANCDGTVDEDDAILTLVFTADVSLSAAGAGCPAFGSGTPKFGDVNCDGVVDAIDALAILQFAADVDIDPPQPGDCTDLGEAL